MKINHQLYFIFYWPPCKQRKAHGTCQHGNSGCRSKLLNECFIWGRNLTLSAMAESSTLIYFTSSKLRRGRFKTWCRTWPCSRDRRRLHHRRWEGLRTSWDIGSSSRSRTELEGRRDPGSGCCPCRGGSRRCRFVRFPEIAWNELASASINCLRWQAQTA